MSLMGDLKVEGVEGLGGAYHQLPINHQDVNHYDPYYNNYYGGGGDYNNINYYQVGISIICYFISFILFNYNFPFNPAVFPLCDYMCHLL